MTYFSAVLADSPSFLWELQETSGTTAVDSANANAGTYTGTYTLGAGGPANVAANAVTMSDLANAGYVMSAASFADPLTTFSFECWFQTTVSWAYGGFIASHGQETFSVAMQSNGYLVIGLWTGAATVSAVTTTAYNDGAWHHLAVTYSTSAGMILYVDTINAASFVSANPPAGGNSNWYVGGLNTGNPLGGSGYGTWCGVGNYCAAAVYPAALTSTQVSNHYAAASAGTNATVTMGPALAATATQPAPQPGSLSSPAYGASYGIIAGGAGSWVNPVNAEGAPDGSDATWTSP